MSKFYVTPDPKAESPIGDMTGYTTDVSEVSISSFGEIFVQLIVRLEVDGDEQARSILPITIEADNWPSEATLNANVLKVQTQFFLETLMALVNTGYPLSLVREIVDGIAVAKQQNTLSIETENGEPYRCTRFAYDNRAVTQAHFAKDESQSGRLVISNGVLSEWLDLDLDQ